jgi:hypothetical protein
MPKRDTAPRNWTLGVRVSHQYCAAALLHLNEHGIWPRSASDLVALCVEAFCHVRNVEPIQESSRAMAILREAGMLRESWGEQRVAGLQKSNLTPEGKRLPATDERMDEHSEEMLLDSVRKALKEREAAAAEDSEESELPPSPTGENGLDKRTTDVV